MRSPDRVEPDGPSADHGQGPGAGAGSAMAYDEPGHDHAPASPVAWGGSMGGGGIRD
jgi:hypothetical protein